MLHKITFVAAVAAFAGFIGVRAEDPKPPPPFSDTEFVKWAASAGMHEVELGKIGSTHATKPDVKQYAEMMVRDHSKANEALKESAKKANIPVPDKMLKVHQQHVNMFRDYKGENFDRDFMQHMVVDHREAVAHFTRASKEAKHKEIKEFATKTLPTLKSHLEKAKKLTD